MSTSRRRYIICTERFDIDYDSYPKIIIPDLEKIRNEKKQELLRHRPNPNNYPPKSLEVKIRDHKRKLRKQIQEQENKYSSPVVVDHKDEVKTKTFDYPWLIHYSDRISDDYVYFEDKN